MAVDRRRAGSLIAMLRNRQRPRPIAEGMQAHRPTSEDSASPPGGTASWWRRAVAVTAVALALTCGGPEGSGTEGARVDGVAWYSGPVRGATVVLHQVVDGVRTRELGRGVTDENGAFSIEHDGFADVEIEVLGGVTAEASGGEVSLDNSHRLVGFVLDLGIGEQRSGVVVSPYTHLTLSLGRARLASGTKESTYPEAVGKALERVSNHLTFDPTRTSIAPVSIGAGSPTEPVKYGLALAGLSEMASLVAAEQGVTIQNINTASWLAALDRDASSVEALFDGVGSEPLFVGASCPPPSGCMVQGPGCFAPCHSSANTLRARLGSAILAFLRTPENLTTLTRDDVATWLEECRVRVDPDLFGNEPAEQFDAVGPTITWGAPAEGAMVSGVVAVEVSATDPVGVDSLVVNAGTDPPLPLTDTNPDPERFEAAFSTVGLGDGLLTLTAVAIDAEGQMSDLSRQIVINNIDGGTVSGVVFKGRVDGATLRVYEFDNGERGALVGEDTADTNGVFQNLRIADGVSGPLLIEAGFGGTYDEESSTATVTLDVADRLRTVVPVYNDGDAISNLTVTPLTTFAVAYLDWLRGQGLGGSTLPERWATARAAMEAQFGVANIYSLTPQAPTEMSTFNAQARYGLIMVGLSELARTASTLGGGDGGTFGPAMNAMRVVRVLETDVADGCWDGLGPAGAQLYFGGTEAVTVQSTRMDLANAIVSYLTADNGARNQTPYAGAADVLTQLDVLANGGGNTFRGSCGVTNMLNPDAGETSFDTIPPRVVFLDAMTMPPGMTPAAGFVRGVITVDALATDNLDMRPTLKFVLPTMTADADGDETDPDARHTFDTTTMANGTLTVTLEAQDDAGRVSDPAMSTRVFTVDNMPPVLTVNAPAGGAYVRGPVTLTFSATDNFPPVSMTATFDGAPIFSGHEANTEGSHTLVVNAVDRAGNMAPTVMRTFTIDNTPPSINVSAPNSGSYVRGPVTLTFSAWDANPGATATATLDGTPISSPHMFNAEGVHTLVVNASDAAGNMATAITRTFTIDNTPPTLSVSAPASGAFVRPTVTLTFSATDNFPGTTVSATLDGNDIFNNHQVIAEGSHTLVVNATDQAGNMANTVMRTFTVDNTAPTLALGTVTPAGAVVGGPLSVTVTANDNFMSSGSLGSDITVAASGPNGAVAPATVTPSVLLPSMARQLVVTFNTAQLPDGMLNMVFNVSDRAGNAASPPLTVTRTVDNTQPVLTWTQGAFVDVGGDWWTGSASPSLTGMVSDANLSTVKAFVGGVERASYSGGSGTWTLTLPPGTVPGTDPVMVTVIATDAAGNTTSTTRALRYDALPPVVAMVDTKVRVESKDVITFSQALDPIFNRPTLNPTHAHTTIDTIDNTTTLGPATACAIGSAPKVVKHAYLLDQAPLYVIESGGTDTGGGNSLKWTVNPTDDGIGISTVRYRVTTATGTVLLDWTNLPSTSMTTIPLYRAGGANPIAALGTTQGLLRIELEAIDRLNRPTTTSRCWEHTLLAAPIAMGGSAVAATSGTAGKFGLGQLTLDSPSPAAPVSMMLTPNPAGGAGIFEFPIFNPTNERVYVSFDMDLPTNSTWSKTYYENKWVYRQTTVDINCGSVMEVDPDTGEISWSPNTSLPGCDPAVPTGSDNTLKTAGPTTLLTSDYGVRVWMDTQTGAALTELTQCSSCSATAQAGSGSTRVTVEVPPRGNTGQPPIRLIVMPVLRPSSSFQPNGTGPFTEYSAAGIPLTGMLQGTLDDKCVQYTGTTTFRCVAQRDYWRVRYLKSVNVSNVSARTVTVFSGISTGGSMTEPVHLPGNANERGYTPPPMGTIWATTEPSDPPNI